jgi:ribosomal protein S18 acetylase RimI-like enzyme
MPVIIRAAAPADAEAITRVYMDSAEHHAAADPERCHLPDRAAIVERYREGRQHPETGLPAITLVAEQNGEITGFLDAQIQQPFDPMLKPVLYCFIADIAVAAPHRSHGIGEQLMQAIETWARENGAVYTSLLYNKGNDRVARLYERLGYSTGSVGMVKRLPDT